MSNALEAAETIIEIRRAGAEASSIVSDVEQFAARLFTPAEVVEALAFFGTITGPDDYWDGSHVIAARERAREALVAENQRLELLAQSELETAEVFWEAYRAEKAGRERVLLEGVVPPEIELPAGFIVRKYPRLELVDAKLVPAKYKIPSMAMIKKLGRKVAVSGTQWIEVDGYQVTLARAEGAEASDTEDTEETEEQE